LLVWLSSFAEKSCGREDDDADTDADSGLSWLFLSFRSGSCEIYLS
jgi:hypothetical protein